MRDSLGSEVSMGLDARGSISSRCREFFLRYCFKVDCGGSIVCLGDKEHGVDRLFQLSRLRMRGAFPPCSFSLHAVVMKPRGNFTVTTSSRLYYKTF
jgi:hypothetical protein